MARRTSNSDGDRCVESATYQTGNVRLDRGAGILHGVKVLGWSSVKKRSYKRSAVEKALPLYDKIRVNLNHAPPGPSDMSPPNVRVQDRFGRLLKPRVEADGLYADLKYNPKHEWAPAFEWFAENEPDAIGLSHDAILRGPMGVDGLREIEEIPRVFSVDIVADPGSTHGLHEDATDEKEGSDETGEPGDDEASLSMQDFHALNDGDDEEPDECHEKAVELVTAVLKDKSLSKAEKRTKVLLLLDKFIGEDEGEGEGEEPETEPEPETEEPSDKEQEEMPIETEQKPGKESAGDVEQVKTLTAENLKLKLELDEFRAKEARALAETEAKDFAIKAGLKDKAVNKTLIDLMVIRGKESWEDTIAYVKTLSGLTVTSTPTSTESGGNHKVSFADFERHVRDN